MLEWIKRHPYLSGGLALGLLVLFFVIRSRSSAAANTAGTSGTAGGLSEQSYVALQEANLQASTQLQGAQIAAGAQANQTAAELAATQVQANAATTQTQLQQQTQLQNILTSGQVGLEQINAQLQLGQTQSANTLAATQSTNETQLGIVGVQAQTLQDQYTQATAQAKIVSDAQVSMAQANADLLSKIAGVVAGNQSQPQSSSYQPSAAPVSAPAPAPTSNTFGYPISLPPGETLYGPGNPYTPPAASSGNPNNVQPVGPIINQVPISGPSGTPSAPAATFPYVAPRSPNPALYPSSAGVPTGPSFPPYPVIHTGMLG
jgi:hypothetical protein